MKLRTINKWLRRIGLVLVLEVETDEKTGLQTGLHSLHIWTANRYDGRHGSKWI